MAKDNRFSRCDLSAKLLRHHANRAIVFGFVRFAQVDHRASNAATDERDVNCQMDAAADASIANPLERLDDAVGHQDADERHQMQGDASAVAKRILVENRCDEIETKREPTKSEHRTLLG